MTVEDAALAIRAAADDGVVAYPLASFGQLEPRPVGVVLGYGAVQLADIPEALRRLARHFGA
jgi:DNA-binding transcriptional MocR family regulator